MTTSNTRFFVIPPINIMGAGCLGDAGPVIASRGIKKALINTDKVMVDLGIAAKLTAVLDASGVAYVVYDGVVPNPTVSNVKDALVLVKENGCDCVISLGGGSAHDSAKMVAAMATNPGDIQDYVGLNKLAQPALPLVAVNTTAGTGSEATLVAVISDDQTHMKMAVGSPFLMPLISVNDPELMLGLPPHITAGTGMDAFTHATEAYLSTMANAVTDGLATTAIQLISENLETVVKDGKNLDARTKMADAAFLAGVAFSNARVGHAHSLSHALTTRYHLPHGTGCGMMLSHVLDFYVGTADARLSEIARLMGAGDRPEDAAAAVRDLGRRAGLADTLAELGVEESGLDAMAEMASHDMSSDTSPRLASKEELRGMLAAAF